MSAVYIILFLATQVGKTLATRCMIVDLNNYTSLHTLQVSHGNKIDFHCLQLAVSVQAVTLPLNVALKAKE